MSYQEEVKNLEKLTGEDLSNLYAALIHLLRSSLHYGVQVVDS